MLHTDGAIVILYLGRATRQKIEHYKPSVVFIVVSIQRVKNESVGKNETRFNDH